MFRYVVVHYNEIGIKGDNRIFFEKKLISNIKSSLNLKLEIQRRYGYILIKLNNEIDISEINSKLQLLPGIAHFSFATSCESDIQKIKEKSLELLKKSEFQTFKIDAKRSNKSFSLNSMEINQTVGEYILNNLQKKVDIHNPEKTLYIEVSDKETYIFDNKIKGVGGLPIGSGEKVICSLSGGIDSPVSAYEFMKRGCEVVLVHIFNNTLVNNNLLKKIKDLAKQLQKIQHKVKLYVVPFAEIQKEIVTNIHPKYRMIIYRRYMLKIINKIANEEKIKLVITGDSVGQVASQTVSNLHSIYEASKLPVLSPLITYNKDDTVDVAKKIGTYKISILQYPDCCSYMIAVHPETKSNLEDILDQEKEIKPKEEQLINSALEQKQIFEY